MILKSNHKYIDFKYKASVTETLDVTMLKCIFFHGEMEVMAHAIFGHSFRCSFYSHISKSRQLIKSNTRSIKFCWINRMMSVILLSKPLFCPTSNIFIFWLLVQLRIAKYTPRVFHSSVNLIKSLWTFLYNRNLSCISPTKLIGFLWKQISGRLFQVKRIICSWQWESSL